MPNSELMLHLFIQIALILVVCRVVGLLVKPLGQPQVVGEMLAGIILGPSLFGLLLPDLHTEVFPRASMPVLYCISQVGLVLYMFFVGAELKVDLLQKNIRSAVTVSMSGIFTPIILGGMLALYLINEPGLFAKGVTPLNGILFLSAAMSITAFPVLARIIRERSLKGTELGNLTLAAGAIDDVSAWCLLAITLATLGNNPMIALFAIGGGLLYTAAVLVIGRPLLRGLEVATQRTGAISGSILSLTLVLMLVGAWFTEAIGIHAVFGAFVLGVAMPRGSFTFQLQHLLEPITTNFLLPLFFIYSGLNTKLGLLDAPYLWLLTVVVLLVAFIGKGVACTIAARLSGQSTRNAFAIGMLMNARGLVELIILNIGLEKGIISPTLFTMMVIMALVTTFIATPLFEGIYRGKRDYDFSPELELAKGLPTTQLITNSGGD